MHIDHARRTTMDRGRSCLARATALAAISAAALLAAVPASASPAAAFTSTAANIHRFVGIQTQVGHTFTAAGLNAIGAQNDIVVALPVVIFRVYAKAWLRGGLIVLGLLILIAFGGVTDTGYLLLTGGLGAGLVVIGFLAGEVSDAMRDREPWSYVVGVGLAVAGAIGSIYAFNVLAPDILSPTAIRWTSVIVFGGAGLAALAGAVLIFIRREDP